MNFPGPALLPCILAAAGGFTFEHPTEGQLLLRESGAPVFVYRYSRVHARGDYLHPLYAPNGAVLTADNPGDEPHHRGVAWMWPVVEVGGKRYDLWKMNGIAPRFERWRRLQASRKRARLVVESGWYAGERKVLEERADLTVYAAHDGQRILELELRFEPVADAVRLEGDNPEFHKGYGGLAIRLASRQSPWLRTDSGEERSDSDMVRHRWAEMGGDFAGRRAALRVDIAPSTPGFPDGWCLRGYGFLGVNYPGLDVVTLHRGRPLFLRFRITTSDGTVESGAGVKGPGLP